MACADPPKRFQTAERPLYILRRLYVSYHPKDFFGFVSAERSVEGRIRLQKHASHLPRKLFLQQRNAAIEFDPIKEPSRFFLPVCRAFSAGKVPLSDDLIICGYRMKLGLRSIFGFPDLLLPGFLKRVSVGMYFARGSVKRQHFDLYRKDFFRLQSGKYSLHDTVFCPTVELLIYCLPFSKLYRKHPPFVPVFGDLQNRVDKISVRCFYIITPNRKVTGYPFILRLAYFHAPL